VIARGLRRAVAALTLAACIGGPGLSGAPAFAQASCGGVDLVAKMRLEDPPRHRRLLDEAKAIPFANARYFRIEKRGLRPSYLFGTIHIADPRALAWVEEIGPRLRASRSVALENTSVNPAGMDPGAAFKFAATMVAREDELLSRHLDAAEVERIAATVGPKLGFSAAAAARLRPWPMILALAYPACEAERSSRGRVVDFSIQAAAEARGVSVRSLETVDDALNALMAPAMETQIDLLRSAMATYEIAEDNLETMVRLLDRGETGLLLAYARDEGMRTLRKPESWTIFMESLIDRRNETMFRNARPLVEQGGAFIAVGALHLPGAKGLAKMFADAGYRVTPMKLRRTTSD
jgi:uncharacterized protein YbaP (TraB family)